MNNTIPHVEGIDRPIQGLQTLLYNRLIALWGNAGLNSAGFEMYGRSYRNFNGDGYIPQAYTGEAGKEYGTNDLFFNDKLKALMWFGLNDPTGVEGVAHTYDVSLYGFVNLDGLKPNSTQRMDEAVLNDVLRMLEPSTFGFKVNKVYRDIDSVTAKYSGMVKKKVLNRDMQPRFAFRIDMSVMLALDYCGAPSVNYPTTPSTMTSSLNVVFKDNPNTALRQRLNNGQYVQLEYQAGDTVTIPFLQGHTFNWPVFMGGGVFMNPTELPFDGVATFDNTAEGGFTNNTQMIIQVNIN